MKRQVYLKCKEGRCDEIKELGDEGEMAKVEIRRGIYRGRKNRNFFMSNTIP